MTKFRRVPDPKRAGGRRLHIIDPENLVGSGSCSEAQVSALHSEYTALAVGSSDLALVASSHFNQMAVAFGWMDGFHLVRSGPSGADLALIHAYREVPNMDSFDGIVIASGDGIFEDIALDAVTRGLPVTVVVGAGALSKRLRMMATQVISLVSARTGFDGTFGSAA
jgi:hypothetical protein